MKRFFTLFLILALVLPVVACAEFNLTDNEQKYVGSWSMYADNGKGTIYALMITFLDSLNVVQTSTIFENGDLKSNNKASGEWIGFTDQTIVLTLAGTDMTAMIKDDGFLYLYFFEDMKLCGVFSKCPDMTSALGW